jgi:predicted metal-dependent phosphoesterase TrpH
LNEWRVDLHIHTTASDGRWTPPDLVEALGREGITLFAVTDHDSVCNVAAAESLARDAGLAFLPGVEISTNLDGRVMHILAYGFDPENAPLIDFIRQNEARLHAYDDELVERLIDAGYSLDRADYAAYTWDRRRGGWKSLNYLIDQGLCRDVHSFFHELFVGDLAVDFPDFPPPAEAIPLIRGAGGVPVWAHPANSLSLNPDYRPEEDEAVVARMVDVGIEGLECFTCYHDGPWTDRLLAWATHFDLLVTGGSDSHGGFVGRHLGRPEIQFHQLRLGQLVDCIIGRPTCGQGEHRAHPAEEIPNRPG